MRGLLFSLLWWTAWLMARGARAVLHVAAGVLDARGLREAGTRRWNRFGLGAEVLDAGLWDWERAHYPRFLRATDRVLLVGCGTGRDLIALLRLGYRVEGLDPAVEALAIARQRLEASGLTAPIHEGDVVTAALPGTFDAVIFSWLSYSYIPPAPARREALRRLRAHLAPGGRVLLSYLGRDARERDLSALTRWASRLTAAGWRAEPHDSVAERGVRRGIEYAHAFAPDDVEAEARAAGFDVVFHDPPPGAATPFVVLAPSGTSRTNST
ncbi:MAG: class I SAM-dependent methyltransferase [Candidatus Rokubacteria bacterium]|nr:class I SAM-dependent methyltransferase [Candidatus Rokubacteria bacterium]